MQSTITPDLEDDSLLGLVDPIADIPDIIRPVPAPVQFRNPGVPTPLDNSIGGWMLYVAFTLLFGMLCLNINCR